MHLVLDAVVLAVAGICLALGWRRGFVDSVKGLVGILLSVIVAATLAQPVGEKIDEAVIRPWAVDQVLSVQGEEVSADTPIAQMDLVAVNEQISNLFHVDILGETTADMTVGGYVEKIITDSGITMGISHALATILLFAGCSVVVWLIGLLLKPILKLPVLRQCNGLLGLLVGAVNAVIVLLVIATAVELFGGSVPNVDLGPQEVEQTVLFKYIDQFNPIANWIIK